MGHRDCRDRDCRDRDCRDEAGFTLVELVTVVVIIGILIVITVPVFSGAQARAEDRAAQAFVRDGLIAAHAVFADTKTYDGIAPADLKAAEPEVSFLASASPAGAPSKQVSVASGSAGGSSYLLLASGSASGACFAALQTEGATQYKRVTSSSCSALSFDPTSGGWSGSWPAP